MPLVHYRVAMNLCFKARLSAKSYANKTYFHKKGSHLGCVPLGNLDLDFKIRISDLQSNAKSEKGISTLRYLFLGSLFTV